MWIKSACVLLAWSIVLIVTAAGPNGPARPAQANNRTANSTLVITLTSTRTAPLPLAAAARAAAKTARYVVQPGDTLSGIAARFGLPGGWQALYAVNRAVIGPDPNVIAAGTVLAVPGATPPARYTVALGDTLSGIAVALGLPGGWQGLYAANKAVIGPDPNLIHAGTVLAAATPSAPAAASPAPSKGTPPAATVPAAPGPAATRPGTTPAPTDTPASSGINRKSSPGHPAPSQLSTQPASGQQPGGVPRWLEDVLLAVGVLAATAFVAEPAAAFARRRRPSGPAGPRPAPSAPPRGPARRAVRRAKIILADYERLIVTYSAREHAVYVLTPPGEDPAAVLRAARLILPEDTYEDLAGHLGVPSGWPLE